MIGMTGWGTLRREQRPFERDGRSFHTSLLIDGTDQEVSWHTATGFTWTWTPILFRPLRPDHFQAFAPVLIGERTRIAFWWGDGLLRLRLVVAPDINTL